MSAQVHVEYICMKSWQQTWSELLNVNSHRKMVVCLSMANTPIIHVTPRRGVRKMTPTIADLSAVIWSSFITYNYSCTYRYHLLHSLY